MTIKRLSIKQSMNKNVQAIMPQEDERFGFENKLISYLETLQTKQTESEEYQKNLISQFLKSLLPKNFINTSNRIDLAIYNGQDSTSSLGVILEVKSLTNKTEMMTRENINIKAFRETVAYYMGERFSGNLEIKKAIITNGFSWFVIEAKELEKYFYKNSKLHNLYDKWQKGQLSSSKTDFPWIIHRISKKQRNPTIHTGLRCFGVSPIGCAYMLRLSRRKPSRKRGFTPSQL
jgi:adenine-specific DNA-methyltransferase